MNDSNFDGYAVFIIVLAIIAALSGVAISAFADGMSDCREMCRDTSARLFVARIRNPTGTPDVPERCERAEAKP